MKRYDFVRLSTGRVIVISNSYVSPLSSIFEISKDLSDMGYQKGEVLFDLLLSNGFSSNRFIGLYFDGEKLWAQSSRVLTKVSDDILNELHNHFNSNEELVNRGSLTKQARERLKSLA